MSQVQKCVYVCAVQSSNTGWSTNQNYYREHHCSWTLTIIGQYYNIKTNHKQKQFFYTSIDFKDPHNPGNPVHHYGKDNTDIAGSMDYKNRTKLDFNRLAINKTKYLPQFSM